ncbi:MAG TPA: kelch repeat-containing protein [Candidatus Binatia bacterium]
MSLHRWYRISGDRPDLDLPPTRIGTRYLQDNDPAHDEKLNPARGSKEFLRRALGRPVRAPWSGESGFAAITEAWNGAAFASGFGASGSMIIFGGGHNDYFGSDVHAFDLATREWSRVSDGYVSGAADDYGAGAMYPDSIYPNGSPLPPHTYNYVQYDPQGNDYILFKGQIELGPNVKALPVPHMFNLDSLTWRKGPRHPSAILNSGGWTTWDASRRLIWGHSGDAGGGNAFIAFCPDGANGDGSFGSWGTHYPNKLPDAADHNAMQIDPIRDIIVITVSASDSLYALDPNQPEMPMIPLKSAGQKPRLSEFAALDYASNLDRLIYYSANDGGRIYSIAPPAESLTRNTWRWKAIVAEDSLDPVADAAAISKHHVNRSHTFGRFRVARYGEIDLAILVRHVDTPVYALRLS